MTKLVTNLWFDSEAEEAARFYTGIFEDSSMGEISYYVDDGHEAHAQRKGQVMTVDFSIRGQDFVALNGGPEFKFNESVSFIVNCESQEEVDFYWSALSEGGDPEAQACGWLKDKYGLSWQIVPNALYEMMQSPDKEKVQKMLAAMYPMKKLDIKSLQDAFGSEG